MSKKSFVIFLWPSQKIWTLVYPAQPGGIKVEWQETFSRDIPKQFSILLNWKWQNSNFVFKLPKKISSSTNSSQGHTHYIVLVSPPFFSRILDWILRSNDRNFTSLFAQISTFGQLKARKLPKNPAHRYRAVGRSENLWGEISVKEIMDIKALLDSW